MRIAYLITHAESVGGAQVHVRDLSTSLCEQGHKVAILTSDSSSSVEYFRGHGAQVIGIPGLKRRLSFFAEATVLSAIKKVLHEWRPDILSTHSSKAGILGRMAAKKLGIPAVFTAHGWAFADGVPEPQRTIYTVVERRAARASAAIIAVSEADAALAVARNVARPPKLHVIHNGMPNRELPSPHQILDSGDIVRICIVARFAPQKDHALLLDALAELEELPWILSLVGTGPGREAVERRVANLGMNSRVIFHGQVPDAKPYLDESHIYALVSNWEGFPRSILEAMRSGLPIIASDVGGVRESVLHNETGILVPRGDRVALVEAFRKLIEDGELRHLLGAAGRDRFVNHFTFERMFERTTGLYREILEQL